MTHLVIGVFGYRESLWKWLISTDHVPNQIVNWAINALLTFGVLAGLIRPAFRRARQEWRDHREAQRHLAATQARVADLLDTDTPGGLTDLVAAVKEHGQ